MKKFSQVLILFLFIQCLGVKNKKNAENLSFLGLLTGGVSNSTTGTTHNGNPLSGTGNGTSNFVTTENKVETGGIVNLGTEVSLSVPAESIEQNTNITVTKVAVKSTDSEIVPIQNGYKFGPENLNFFEPATLKVCYNPEFLKQKKLNEKDIQVFYVDPDTKELASVGGTVDLVAHCVSAKVEHFSTYVPAVSINVNTTVSSPTLLPARPISGQPLRLRTRIIPANGATITSAILNYRVKGQTTFNSVVLNQDTTDVTNRTFFYNIPSADVSLSGLEYFLQVTDSNNKTRRVPNTNFTSRTITKTLNITTPLRYNIRRASINMADGTFRNLSLQVLDNDGLWQTTFSESNDLTGNIGVLNVIGNTIRFTAETLGTGTLTSTYGGNQISLNINVVAGRLASIKFLDGAGVVITNPLNIIQGQTANLQILGYDVMGNFKTINPTITATNGIGTFNKPTGIFTASNTTSSGKLTAAVGTISGSIDIHVVPPFYTISGVATGIQATGKSIILQNNGGDDLTISQDGSFSFATSVASGGSYNISMPDMIGYCNPYKSYFYCYKKPEGLNCTLSNATGSAQFYNVTNVVLTCEKAPEVFYSIGNDPSTPSTLRNIYATGTFTINNKVYMTLYSNSKQRSYIREILKDGSPGDFPIPDIALEIHYHQVIDNEFYFVAHLPYRGSSVLFKFDGNSITEILDVNSLLALEVDGGRNNGFSGNNCSFIHDKNSLAKLNNTLYISMSCFADFRPKRTFSLNKIYKVENNNITPIYSYDENSDSRMRGIFIMNNELYFVINHSMDNTYGFKRLFKFDQNLSPTEISPEVFNNLNDLHGVRLRLIDNKLFLAQRYDNYNNYKLSFFDGTSWSQITYNNSDLFEFFNEFDLFVHQNKINFFNIKSMDPVYLANGGFSTYKMRIEQLELIGNQLNKVNEFSMFDITHGTLLQTFSLNNALYFLSRNFLEGVENTYIIYRY